jgi:DNA-binding response OmpR family regulator
LAKLLLVDDDLEFAQHITALMKNEGWIVEYASTGADAAQLLTNYRYDFILLDINLPDMEGIDVCRNFRLSGGDTPIVYISGRHAVVDKEAGLDAGGDDYLTKPFDARELLARIRSVQRRDARQFKGKLKVGSIEIDTKIRVVSSGAKQAQISQIECNILEFLLRNRNQYFTAAQLFEAVWPSEADASTGTVKVHMSLLRRKLALLGCADLIKTVRNAGYIVVDGSKDTGSTTKANK